MEVYDNHSPPMQLAAVFTDVEDGNGGSSSSSGGGGGDGSGSGSSNADNHSSYQQSHQPLLPLYAQIIVIVAYTTIIVVAVGGNSLVVATVVSRRSMRTVTNWFIVNLACADTLMATLCIPPTFIADVLLLYWPFGAALCPLVGYAQMSSVFLCAFTLVGISIDRHRAIRHPLRARLTGRQLAVAVGVIWTAALLFPLPVAIFSRLVVGGRLQSFGGNDTTVTATDGTATASTATLIVLSTDVNCEEVWPEWHWPADSWKYGYSVTIMIAQYFLPLAVLTVTYASIAYTVWLKRRPPGEPLDKRDNKMAASKKKVGDRYAHNIIRFHNLHLV
jgi:neuropeptide Y receptor